MKRKKKLPEYEERIKDAVYTSAYNSVDVDSWRLFYNKYNPKKYTYFTQVKDKKETYVYPARFRWIPIQRKNLNVLISNQQLRPFVYDVSVSDNDSINRKFHSSAMGMVNFIFNEHKNYYEKYNLALQQIQEKRQQMQQILQKDPKDEKEAAIQQQIRQEMPMINSRFNILEENMQNQQVISKERMEDAKKFFLYEAEDIVEQTAQKLSMKIRASNEFKEESNIMFTSTLVTGKGYYYVNHDSGNKNITIKAVDQLDVVYPMIPSIRWTHMLPWIGLKERWSTSDVIRLYGHLLTDAEIKDMKDQIMTASNSNPVFLSTRGEDGEGGAMLATDGRFSYSGSPESSSQEVLRVWYIKERKIQARVTPNKYNPARPHIHFVDDDNLKNHPIRKDKGEKLQVRYISERYYGITINGKIHLGYELDEMQPRDANNLSKVYLPIVGKTFSSITDQPYSLIQETKDLAELYNIINYHRELYVAVSGVKGQIIDTSQKPTDMSLAAQRYYRKLGSTYIQTKTKGGRNIGSNYNQWKGYDDSISPAVAQLDSMLETIDQTLGILMGVPRQRIGQTVSTDQVGSNEQAVHMANLVTEKLHYEHDVVNAKALEMAINLHMNYLLKPNELISIPSMQGKNEIFKVPNFDTKNSQISIRIENNGKELRLKEELKAAANAGYGRGELPLDALLKIYTTDSVKELEKKLLYLTNKASKDRQEGIQAEKDSERQKQQLIFESEMTLKQEDIKARIAELKTNMQIANIQDKTKNREISVDQGIELMKLGAEKETDATYLKEQNRASTVDEELRYLEIMLNNIQTQKELKLQEKQGDKKHLVKMKKTKDTSSIKKQKKEKIKDK